MLTKISFLAFVLCLSLVKSAVTPGMVISRSFTDVANNIRAILPNALGDVSYTKLGKFNFTTLDSKTSVVCNITNIVLLNSTMKSTPALVNVMISSPNFLNITLNNFTGTISYSYSEVGKKINNTGTGYTTFTANLTFFTTVSYGNGLPIITINKLNYIITNYTQYNLTNLSTAIVTAIQTNLTSYLSNNATAFFIAAFQNQTNSYISRANYWPTLPGTKVKADLTWVAAPVINYNASLSCQNNYVSFWVNGTVTTNSSSISIPTINPPVALPNRFTNSNAYVGQSQVFITQFTIDSYYYSTLKVYGHYTIDTLPTGFPNILNTNSGYFPELNKIYPNSPVTLNVTFYDTPRCYIIGGYGIQGKLPLTVQVLIYSQSTNEWSYPLAYNVTITFSVNIYFNQTVIVGYSYNPIISNLVQINSNAQVGNVNVYYLGRLTTDLFKQYMIFNEGSYLFPKIPFPYLSGTTFSNVRSRLMQGYIEVDYDPTIPTPSGEEYNRFEAYQASAGC
ncbi:unnamed protein product [Blepharisma stoltei]|uniref:Uncharacterized protein n=1 Tax=Blepharisma stoltei TaxID=1481888 RepID=A0AAU9JPP2_9CILI|nr:unnamed protein product [Blepharisma stoltei]